MSFDRASRGNNPGCRAIQFLHSGKEPPVVRELPEWHHLLPEGSPGAEHYVPWNMSPDHYRRFMASQGRFLRDPDSAPETGEIGFWGEWEPPTYGNPITPDAPNGPTFMHRPVLLYDNYEWRRRFPRGAYRACGGDDNGCMNTDPFVFGNEFYYTLCRQEKNPLLRRLDSGSIILFGSRKGRKGAWEFVIDTVFVVGASMPFPEIHARVHNSNHPAGTIDLPDIYRRVTFDMIPGDADLRFYFGAMYDTACNGMYSFVPCVPTAERQGGFPRPVILRDSDLTFISSGMTQGISTAMIVDAEHARPLWNRVVEIVLAEKLCLGIGIAMPPHLQ